MSNRTAKSRRVSISVSEELHQSICLYSRLCGVTVSAALHELVASGIPSMLEAWHEDVSDKAALAAWQDKRKQDQHATS